MTCPNKSKNEKTCPCTETDCPNHGICCQCIRAHKGLSETVACMRK